ncbi:MAG: GntR family transcriptional regulator [Planctomycetota bacterium]
MKYWVEPHATEAPSEQLARQIRFAIANEQLRFGDRVPSVRALAAEALVNPNTVAKAYRQLEWEKIVESKPGDGIFVTSGAFEICKQWRDGRISSELRRALNEARLAGIDATKLSSWIQQLLKEPQGAGHEK